MEMHAMRVTRLDDGLGVVIPKEVAEALRLKEGDDVSVWRDDGGKLVMGITPPPDISKEDFLATIRKFQGTFPADFKFDREEANKRR
jgi:antitoxin MazE